MTTTQPPMSASELADFVWEGSDPPTHVINAINQYSAQIRNAALEEAAKIIEAKPFYQSMAARHLRHLSKTQKQDGASE